MTEPAEIRVVDHDASWRHAFEVEHDRLRAALGPIVYGVEHIGSTAVPGLAAKPILDIMVGIARQQDVEPAASRLADLDYGRWPAGDVPAADGAGAGSPARHLAAPSAWHRHSALDRD